MTHTNYNITHLLQQYQCHNANTKEIGMFQIILNKVKIIIITAAHLSFIQRLQRLHELKGHSGCVNCARYISYSHY